MSRIFEGKPKAKGKKIAVVVSKFNEFVTKRLLDACLKELIQHGVKKADITVAWVPGSFEIPVAALKLAKKRSVSAVICLGAIIRGETLHFELVARGSAFGIAQASIISGKPVIFEVLATDTVQQANERSKLKGNNKGRDAAVAALEMIDLFSKIN